MLVVREATDVTEELLHALARLIPQLSATSPTLTASALKNIIASPGTTLFIAQMGSLIVGTLSLVVFQCPTGTRAIIEDVVVDTDSRRFGVGEAITREAVKSALRAGARRIDLTSRPDRIGANKLYQKLGFKLRQTNNYRLDCDSNDS